MQPVVLYAAGTAVMVAVSVRRPDARVAAFAVAAIWLVSIICARIGVTAEQCLTVGLAADWLAAIGFILAWRIIWPPREWLAILALTFFGQVAAHWAYHPGPGAAYRLQLTLNILYAAQLLTVVVGPRAGEWVRHACHALSGRHRGADRRLRPRGVGASLDAGLRWVGAAALREKRR